MTCDDFRRIAVSLAVGSRDLQYPPQRAGVPRSGVRRLEDRWQTGPATWLTVFAANGRRPFPARPSYANAPRRQGKLRHDQQNHARDGSGTFAKNSILTRGKGRSERPIQRPLRLKVAAMSPVISVRDRKSTRLNSSHANISSAV